jgi:hypothetical protein
MLLLDECTHRAFDDLSTDPKYAHKTSPRLCAINLKSRFSLHLKVILCFGRAHLCLDLHVSTPRIHPEEFPLCSTPLLLPAGWGGGSTIPQPQPPCVSSLIILSQKCCVPCSDLLPFVKLQNFQSSPFFPSIFLVYA